MFFWQRCITCIIHIAAFGFILVLAGWKIKNAVTYHGVVSLNSGSMDLRFLYLVVLCV